jgi:adenylosuccinate synthase
MVLGVAQRLVVVVSGPVAGGKSVLARRLAQRFAGSRLSTRELLMPILEPGETPSRQRLQQIGTELDDRTGGTWVADRFSRRIFESGTGLVVIDSARIAGQLAGLRSAFSHEVRHVHITASRETCAERYELRRARAEVEEATSYDEVMADPTEAKVDSLGELADISVDTDRNSEEDVLVRVASQLGLLDRRHAPCVDVLVGGEYGSEGKGNIAFYLAPEYDLLIRVGGPNAAHKVYLASGEIFTHTSLPSGTQNGEAHLVIGPGAVIFPEELQSEIARCDVSVQRLSIDPEAMIIETSDKKAEAALRERIASTASGAGNATARRVLRGEDVRLAEHIPELHPYIRPTIDVLERAYASGQKIMLEGTQGSGLSLYHGPYPTVTSRDTNAAGCLAEAGIAPARVRRTIMVVRTYPIRVGGPSGQLTTELSWDEIERRSGLEGLAAKELTSKTKTQRRVGEFEWDLLRRAAVLNAPTDIALTFADYLGAKNAEAWRFEQLTEPTISFIEEVERVTGAKVSLISTGFMQHRGIIDRRQW